ncbi:hypothetical protein B0H19DRAFT_1078040 [Mycena capillaripes]|nr:hypothetical protein B0H19DRAFT_1078040 [Mycena capillaripes]
MHSALLQGVAVLESPRIIPKTKTVVFDRQFFLSSTEPTLIGSFRYFNGNDVELTEVGCYGVAIRLTRPTPTVEVFLLTLTPADYNTLWMIFPRAKFSKYKPIPAQGKCGFLTGLERNDDKLRTVKYFIVDVDTFVFPGQPAGSSAPKAEESPTKIARLKLTGFFGSQGSDTKSEEPAQKKRKTADDRNSRQGRRVIQQANASPAV